ncbi:hypothetical protein LAZ67_4002109 [Cordylochernes scorpioides]|uniref:Uncharacterized protein n=1 Tax=Cordylochernes scorpioides TaxID=51811 RepID=A0ABY6KCI6_9ARAC|nr:hypothetical protein LAZ67_4002109 [Cordylochernes scorpioides]
MFSEGREDVNDEERAGRPSTSTTDEKINKVEKMILANRRITVREVAEDLNKSIGSCHSIFINDLGMRRVAAKFVPKFLNCDQKQHRMNIANEMLDSVRDNPNLLQRVITGDEAHRIPQIWPPTKSKAPSKTSTAQTKTVASITTMASIGPGNHGGVVDLAAVGDGTAHGVASVASIAVTSTIASVASTVATSVTPASNKTQKMPGHRKRRQFKQTDAFTRGMVIGLKRAARVDRRILRQAVAAPQATCTAILQHVQDTLDHSISTRTISRRLVANETAIDPTE